jgi:hypothetical protein
MIDAGAGRRKAEYMYMEKDAQTHIKGGATKK